MIGKTWGGTGFFKRRRIGRIETKRQVKPGPGEPGFRKTGTGRARFLEAGCLGRACIGRGGGVFPEGCGRGGAKIAKRG